MSIQFNVCGPRGSYPSYGKDFNLFGHDTNCYLIKDDDYAIILDCGSGFLNTAKYLKDVKKIDVLLTHVHYDHIMGLFDNAFLNEKITDFYGDFNAWNYVIKENKNKTLYSIENLIPYRKHQIELNKYFDLRNGYKIRFVSSIHPNKTYMIDIIKDNKRICFTGDYEHDNRKTIGFWAKDCDFLLFDGTYADDEYLAHKGWGHSKWSDACKIAKEFNIKKLVVTHHAPNHDDEFLLKQEDEAKKIFENVVFAKQGDVYNI